MSHLFVSYVVPVSMAYTVDSDIMKAPSHIEATASSASSALNRFLLGDTSPSCVSNASSDTLPWLKKMAFLAVNAPGLAYGVRDGQALPDASRNNYAERSGHDVSNVPSAEKTFHRLHHQHVRCLDNNGQVFAILLNVAYLIPLTVLFLRFFAKTYIRIPTPSFTSDPAAQFRRLSESARSAVRETSETIGPGARTPDDHEEAIEDEPIAKGGSSKANGKSSREYAEENARVMIEKARSFADRVEEAGEATGRVMFRSSKTVVQKLSEKMEQTSQEVVENGGSSDVVAEDSTESKESNDDSRDHDQETAQDSKEDISKKGLKSEFSDFSELTNDSMENGKEEDAAAPDGSASTEFVKVDKGSYDEDAHSDHAGEESTNATPPNEDKPHESDGQEAVEGPEYHTEAPSLDEASPDGDKNEDEEKARMEEADGKQDDGHTSDNQEQETNTSKGKDEEMKSTEETSREAGNEDEQGHETSGDQPDSMREQNA